jgi:hypothetical protein
MGAQRNSSGALAHLCFAIQLTRRNGTKYVFRFSLQPLFETFFVPINIQRVTPKLGADTRVKCPSLLSDFNLCGIKVTKTSSVTHLLHANQTHMAKLCDHFWNILLNE